MSSPYLWFLLPAVIIVLVTICLLIGVIYRRTSGRCTSTNRMTGKTVIVTGANAGIGYWTAHDLASRGARVILACRNADKAEKARETITRETKNENVVVKIVDISDLNSVRQFCRDILTTEERLDVLINNAGAGFKVKSESAQGYELTIATNQYGPYLLTILLLELLKKSSPSRIINVSSLAHKHHSGDFSDIHFKVKKYTWYQAYAQSKLCNVLFTRELSRKLADTGVTVNSLHPGVVVTDFGNKEESVLKKKILYPAVSHLIKDGVLGAQTAIHLAVADEVAEISGEYFVDCKIAKVSKKAKDPFLAKKVWFICEEEVGLTEEEII